jgi:hypothetical protein
MRVVTGGGYDRDRLLSSGDIVKTVAASADTTGSLKINTATTGDSIPQRYTFSLSGPAGSTTDTIGVNSSRTFAGITTGDYTVQLTAVPTNCTLGGSNPRVVTVRAGETDSTTFAVTCTAATSGTGNLTITTATTGTNIPPGYTFSVSGPAGSTTDTIGASSSRTFAGIAAGDYGVVLRSVPTNCGQRRHLPHGHGASRRDGDGIVLPELRRGVGQPHGDNQHLGLEPPQRVHGHRGRQPEPVHRDQQQRHVLQPVRRQPQRGSRQRAQQLYGERLQPPQR